MILYYLATKPITFLKATKSLFLPTTSTTTLFAILRPTLPLETCYTPSPPLSGLWKPAQSPPDPFSSITFISFSRKTLLASQRGLVVPLHSLSTVSHPPMGHHHSSFGKLGIRRFSLHCIGRLFHFPTPLIHFFPFIPSLFYFFFLSLLLVIFLPILGFSLLVYY